MKEVFVCRVEFYFLHSSETNRTCYNKHLLLRKTFYGKFRGEWFSLLVDVVPSLKFAPLNFLQYDEIQNILIICYYGN
jgi:hypothetical protein